MLASGSGTNLQTLIDDPEVKGHIACVVSDKPSAPALQRAHQGGIPAEVVRWDEHGSRELFSIALADAVEKHGGKGVILAGFMRILSKPFIDRFPGRVINIHPSLLPAFPGRRAVEDALSHGVKVSGVTVHFVDEQVDHGPIIAQRAVPVRDEDTVETLHARVQQEEHQLYPAVVRAFIAERVGLVDGKVVWD